MKTLDLCVKFYEFLPKSKDSYFLPQYLTALLKLGILTKSQISSAIQAIPTTFVGDPGSEDDQASMAWMANSKRSMLFTLLDVLKNAE